MPFELVRRRWDWIGDGVLPYSLAGMRAVWITTLIRLLTVWIEPASTEWLDFWTVFILLALSTALTHFGAFVMKSERRAALLIAIAGVLVCLMTFYLRLSGGEFALWETEWLTAVIRRPVATGATFLLVVSLWWLGIRAGSESLQYEVYLNGFMVGMLALAGASGVSYATGLFPLRETITSLLIFFALGLATLAIASIQSTRRLERQRASEWLAWNRPWMVTVAVVIVLLLLLGVLLGQLFSPDLVTRLLDALGSLLDILLTGLLWVVYGIVYLIFLVLEPLIRLLQSLRVEDDQPVVIEPFSMADQLEHLAREPAELPAGLFVALRIVGALLLLSVVVLLFFLAFRRFQELSEDEVAVERDSVLTMELLRAQLSQLFRRSSSTEKKREPFVRVSGNDPSAQVRRTYQSFLGWAVRLGVPRPRGMSPAGFARLLGRIQPAYEKELLVITQGYLQARYGLPAVTAEQADHIDTTWEHIMERERIREHSPESRGAA